MQRRFHPHLHVCRSTQHGMGLVEVMVGMTIGLMVVAAAITTLLAARNLTASTTELAQLQQQAAYVFRVVGQQIRQAGGRALHTSGSASTWAALDPQPSVALLLPIQGTDAPHASEYALVVRQQNSNQKLYTAKAGVWEDKPLLRNCLAENTGVSKAPALSSSFKLHNGQLVCAGTAAAQPLLPDITDFQLRYLVTQGQGTATSYQYVQAQALSTPEQWRAVRGVEVCLEMTGQQPAPSLEATYRTCDGTLAVRSARLQRVFRNFYHTPSDLWTLGP